MQVIYHRFGRLIITTLVWLGLALMLPVATHAMSGDTLIALTNQQRQAAGLQPLAVNHQLTASAQAKATDMFQQNYWSHFSPSGTSPWYFMQQSGYQYVAAGENLAKDFQAEADVVTGWMNSPAHRDNILNPAYKEIGIAVSAGQLVGSETILVVAHYGATTTAPAPAAAAAAPAPPMPQPAPAPASAIPTNTGSAVAAAATIKPPKTPAAKQQPAKQRSLIPKLFALFNKASTQYGLYGLSS